MVIERGVLYWVDLGDPAGSRPGKHRPVLIVQADAYNASRLATVIAVTVTSNTSLAALPGNVFLPATATGLPRDSVVSVTALVTVDEDYLGEPAGAVPGYLLEEVDRGLRRVLDL
ncbi:MAG: type II toxin-antitoxin system PemK/MazF family toxin [Frankiaceae bacterium]